MAYKLNAKVHVLKNGNEKVTSNYGNRTFTNKGKTYSGFHGGIDLICGKNGTDHIIAFHDGKISQVRNSVVGYNEKLSAGNYVYIDHDNGYQSRYCHLKKDTLCVKKGDKVKKCDVIAYMGSTGFSTGNHLHFEIRKNGKTVNPKNYLLGTNKISQINNIKNTSSLIYNIGDKVMFTGYLYRDSYGNGKGAYKKDLEAQIYLINSSGKCPYNINNGLGWVKEENLQLQTSVNNKYYVVKKNDTLSSIASKYNTTYKKLYELNKVLIDNENNKRGISTNKMWIYPGQKILLQ